MNLLKHWLVLAALAAAPLLRGGDGNIGVSALPAPDWGRFRSCRPSGKAEKADLPQ